MSPYSISVIDLVNQALIHELKEKMDSSTSQLMDDKYMMEYSYWKETNTKVAGFRNDQTAEEMQKVVDDKLKVLT